MREPAKELKGLDDVVSWARETLAEGGSKFTPLSKSSQYEIAKVVLSVASRSEEEGEPDQEPSPQPAPVEAPATTAEVQLIEETESPENDANPTPCDEKTEDPIPDNPCGCSCGCGNGKSDAKVTRAEHFHGLRETPQAAYDAFAKYCEDHPQERKVMDFQTGEKSGAAAFAYWLLGSVGEELTSPVKPRQRDAMNDWDT